MNGSINSICGYHGTALSHVASILENGFNPSVGDEEWLGDGVYFFIEGMSKSPQDQAESWAIVSSWNNEKKRNDYDKFAVLEAIIKVEDSKFLDLTTPDGIEIFDYLQRKCIEKLSSEGRKFKLKYIDGYLINFAATEGVVEIEAVKGGVYIKLTKEDRIFNSSRRTYNCTICSVRDPKKNIINIKKIKEGRV